VRTLAEARGSASSNGAAHRVSSLQGKKTTRQGSSNVSKRRMISTVDCCIQYKILRLQKQPGTGSKEKAIQLAGT
jgi:hypothetical protein